MDTLEWLSELIRFDTTSCNSNLDLINYVQNWLSDQSIKSHLIHDPEEPKANLFATIPAKDGSTNGGLILSGHTDVVPVDGQQWNSNPFEASLLGDKIYGRGACDMKGFIAVALALVPELIQLKVPFPIHLAFSYDEEIGCRGVPFMINDLKKLGIQPKACIVGEPTDMKPVVAHKGKQSFRCSVHGTAAHSSLTTKGCNAIEYGARLICYVREMANQFKKNGPFDSHYDVPYTTLTTNLIKGGNAQNTIPAFCEFIFEFRNLPENDPNEIRSKIDTFIQHELLPEMRKEAPEADLILDPIAGGPGLKAVEEADILRFAREVSGHHDPIKVSYGTEAGLFQRADIPTIICGPGSIEQAHRANEYVTMDQLMKCERFLRDIIQKIVFNP